MSTPETPTTEEQMLLDVAKVIDPCGWDESDAPLDDPDDNAALLKLEARMRLRALHMAQRVIDAARPHLTTWPSVPDGWTLGDLSGKGAWEEFGSSYSCSLWSKSDPSLYVVGHGTKPQDAMQAAIDKIALQGADAA